MILYIIFIYFILNCCVILHIFQFKYIESNQTQKKILVCENVLANKHDSDSDVFDTLWMNNSLQAYSN